VAEERLQKVLAAAGVVSRRGAEAFIVAGRVRVNGLIVRELGVKVSPRKDRIELDGRLLEREPPVYVLLNKPKAVMSTLRDPEGRRTVVELVRGAGARLKPVGRLDYHTSGALLLTNDGEFAARLQHPRYGIPRSYSVKVRGELSPRTLDKWRESIVIDGRATQPAEVTRLRTEDGKTWLSVVLREGRNRHVRRLAEHAGCQVMRLLRVEFAGINLADLRPGAFRYLTADELKMLRERYGVPVKVAAASRQHALSAEPARRAARPSPRTKPAPRGESEARGTRAPRAKRRSHGAGGR
jgi:23S rRNA pseudouridine2605 synthase